MMKHPYLFSFGPLLALMLSASGASAQAPPTKATPPAPTATADTGANCAPAQVSPRSNIAPEGTTTGQAGEPLSDKLSKSNGVLCPPSEVDPQIRAPTPDAGNTPVIPPPGSPGGNPNVLPK